MPKPNWFSKITPEILSRAGPGRDMSTLVDIEDRHKVVGPASAKGVILNNPSAGTEDRYATAATQRKLR